MTSAFVWLGATLTGAPALSGSPAGAVHLNSFETSALVTRSGVQMASFGSGVPAVDGGLFGNLPGWTMSNAFHGVLFQLPAGVWEFAVIAASQSWGGGVSGTVAITENPYGANTLLRSLDLLQAGGVLVDTDNTAFTGASALADTVAALTYLPVTVADRGDGFGLIKVGANGVNVSAIALRQPVVVTPTVTPKQVFTLGRGATAFTLDQTLPFALPAPVTTFILETEQDMTFPTYTASPKDPADVEDYGLDCSAWLNGQTIAAVTVVADDPALTISNIANAAGKATWRAAGGTLGKVHQMRVRVESNTGRKAERTVAVLVADL